MQRRKPASQTAHIAAPGYDSGEGKASRLSQRSMGVTNRIWLIVALILFILAVTHYAIPSSAAANPTIYSNAHLKPVNYLNASEETPNPFDFCPVHGPGDSLGLKYGARVISQSRLHLGSGARIQRLLHRALAGQPVTISVIGGSVSACHGAGDDPISPTCYPSKFFQWWNTIFPNPASELTNGAMRRADSAYFGYCSAHHIPDVTDLVIIELDTDDNPDTETIEYFEVLIRSILIRADQPAVLLLGHFSPQVHQTHGFAGPDHWHNLVAQFYDVPHITVKSALFNDYMHDPTSINKYYVDPILASPLGHELMSDILVAYFQNEICSAWGVFSGASYDTSSNPDAGGESHGLFGGVGQRKGVPEPGSNGQADKKLNKDYALATNQGPINVPMARINSRPNSDRPFQEISPHCVSANDLINPLPPSLFIGSGWTAYHPSTGSNSLQAKSHYWYSTTPTSRIRIPIVVGSGDIGVYYIEDPISSVGTGSSVECWVDDNYPGAKTLQNAANVGEATARLVMIDHYVARGPHFVECQMVGEEGPEVPMFKIIGVFTT